MMRQSYLYNGKPYTGKMASLSEILLSLLWVPSDGGLNALELGH